MKNLKDRSEAVKRIARRLGFSFCGISAAAFLEEEARDLDEWLKQGRHGSMAWMERNFDKRLDPRLLVPGAKSVISLMLNYYPGRDAERTEGPKISAYAYGKDYHIVIKEKLREFLQGIREELGDVNGRAFVDSAPVMDKTWAKRSGLGWIGKNTNLINKESGSFFFLAELITDLELEPDGPVKDHCGDCMACLDACPTGALDEPYRIDARKCISYLTIELKENIPSEFNGKMDDWIFGCDICQDVCPWNSFSQSHREEAFRPIGNRLLLGWEEWQEMTEELFLEMFRETALMRAGWKGMKKNLEFVTKKKSPGLRTS